MWGIFRWMQLGCVDRWVYYILQCYESLVNILWRFSKMSEIFSPWLAKWPGFAQRDPTSISGPTTWQAWTLRQKGRERERGDCVVRKAFFQIFGNKMASLSIVSTLGSLWEALRFLAFNPKTPIHLSKEKVRNYSCKKVNDCMAWTIL